MNGLRIPFTGLRKQYSQLRTEILDVTDEVLRSGQVMSGNWTIELENWLARKNRVKHAITCHSGTQALEIIASFLRDHARDEPPRVAVPALTYVATINAWLKSGWDVDIIDVDAEGLMKIGDIDIATTQTLCLVGLYGHATAHISDAQSWQRVVLNNLTTVEDAAQHWLSADCTRMGIAAAISFDPTKNLNAYGNGGAVLTNDTDLAVYARNWCSNGKYDDHRTISTNSRISEVDAAQLMVKTRYIDQWQSRRAKIAQHWMQECQNLGVRSLINRQNIHEHCFHKFVIDVDRRDDLATHLRQCNVETRIHYDRPLHEYPAFSYCRGPGLLSAASALSRRVLSLPIYPELTDLEVEYIIDSVRDFFS